VFGLFRVVAAHPGVLFALRRALAAQPRVQRLLDPPVDVLRAGLELVSVELLDHALLPPRPDGLFARAYLNFNMGAQVFLLLDVRVLISAFPEDQIPWLHLLKGYIRTECVHLVCLVPRS